MITWPILPPKIGERIQEVFGFESDLVPLKIAKRTLDASPESRRRVYETASRIANHIMNERPGWGPWPEDLHECMSIGLVLGIF
jgi:hypothetical protein